MFFLYSVRNLIMADVDLRNMLCATRQHLAVLVLLMSSIFFFPSSSPEHCIDTKLHNGYVLEGTTNFCP